MDQLPELQALISRHADGSYRPTALPGIKVMEAPAQTQSLGGVAEPTFSLVAQGSKRAIMADLILDYHEGQYLVVSVDLPMTAHITRASAELPFLAFSMSLKPAQIAALLLETASGDKAAATPSGVAVSDANADLLDPIVRLLRLLDRPEDIRVLAPAIEREILWRLITGEQGAMIRQIGLADSRLSQVGRAIRLLRKQYATLLRIDDLAEAAGMSTTSFHRHFRAVTSMSPIQYQKLLRLQEARALLVAEAQDVAAVGFAVGYDSPSQFSREYRRLFGVPPSKDLALRRDTRLLEQAVH
jgi:AraC-like DNA-binding protein